MSLKIFLFGMFFNRVRLDEVKFTQKATEIRIKEKQGTKALPIQFFTSTVSHQLLRLLDHPYGIVASKWCTIL